MQKTCVFIIGTNGVGKTTLAKRLINDFGGIAAYKDKITYCNDGRACFVGRYEGVKFGGVDGLNNTTQLAAHVKTGLNTREVVFCEGKYIKSFSINMTNAMFQAKRGVVIFIYAPVSVLNERLRGRAGGGGMTEHVWKDQKAVARTAKKWQEIGVKLVQFDTSQTTTEYIANKVKETVYGVL